MKNLNSSKKETVKFFSMINSDKYELVLARGFLRKIKEAVEQGIYPDKEKGKEKVDYYQTRVDYYTEKLKELNEWDD